jgi:N-acetylmuramic acid 6-phosphate etherase
MTSSKWRHLPTEAINPRTLDIDRLSTKEMVALMAREDRRVLAAVGKTRPQIARAVDLIVRALKSGGRVFFVGAGTSGRLGVLEAAEVPPTFGTPRTLVQAVIAGGHGSVFRAREGAEDDFDNGVAELRRRRVTARDVVVGVSASGVTAFVRGALGHARAAGARRILVTCRPGRGLGRLADVVITPEVGPEVITGSTRLKAGTATKMVLNMLTTLPMVRVGKTYGNLMVDVRMGSAKLKDRATRMVTMVTGLPPDEAERLLQRAGAHVKTAIVMARTGDSRRAAQRRLRRSDDSVRAALGEDLDAALRYAYDGTRRRPARRASARRTAP